MIFSGKSDKKKQICSTSAGISSSMSPPKNLGLSGFIRERFFSEYKARQGHNGNCEINLELDLGVDLEINTQYPQKKNLPSHAVYPHEDQTSIFDQNIFCSMNNTDSGTVSGTEIIRDSSTKSSFGSFRNTILCLYIQFECKLVFTNQSRCAIF